MALKRQILGIIGPNGAGKSTIHKVLTTVTARTNGEVYVMGTSLSDLNFKDHSGEIGFVSQQNVFWEDLTVDQNLKLIGNLQGMDSELMGLIMSKIKAALDLGPYSEKKAKYLSGGNKRKLCFAMALLPMPRIVLLDEPSNGLDPIARKGLYNFLKN
jgi:ABC-type multidrug transport system ATPase subunit